MTVVSKVQSKVPQLRFSKFSGDWCRTELGNILKVKSGLGFKAEEYSESGVRLLQIENVGYGEIKWTTPANLPEQYLSQYPELSLSAGDIVLALNRPVTNGQLKIAVLGEADSPSILYQRVGKLLILPEKAVAKFVFFLFQLHVKKFVERQSIGSDQPFISINSLYRYKVYQPENDEQNKIATFLSTVDKKISLLKQKHEQLVQYKKGIMQQLFSQQLRFKDDDGQDFPDWEVTKFKQHFERVTQKNKINNLNVLTISGQRGLINQQKYFNKSVSAQDVTGYYLMNKGEFAYNKSYSKGYPMGAIKRLNNYDKGVVSTLYICFKSKNGDDRFWEQYFEAGLLNREIQKIAQEGARNHGLLNVSVKEFFDDMKMHSPDEGEQAKIADFLESIDQKINLAQQKIEQTQTFKQGLLQQMFV
jgi:type I restriction enzyme S subunit